MTDYVVVILRMAVMVLLLIVFAQDIKHRSIDAALLILLLFAVCALSFTVHRGWRHLAINATINCGFIVLQTCLLSVYIVLRFRVGYASILKFIGLGDLLFWIVICPLVTFPDFIVHFIVSLVLALILHAVFCRFSFYQVKTVPLAGMQSMYYCMSLLFQTVIDLKWS